MSLPRSIKPYHFQANLIWWDSPFKCAVDFKIKFSLYSTSTYVQCRYVWTNVEQKVSRRRSLSNLRLVRIDGYEWYWWADALFKVKLGYIKILISLTVQKGELCFFPSFKSFMVITSEWRIFYLGVSCRCYSIYDSTHSLITVNVFFGLLIYFLLFISSICMLCFLNKCVVSCILN